MSYMPLTPFRRTDQAVQNPAPSCDQKQDAIAPVDKWEALRELAVCRGEFGLNDRDLTVLQALLSFHPKRELTDNALRQVVFASNNSLCERLNGMPCSTMRRHLAKLVSAGVIRRRDSPNGKRYTRRYGPVRIAFGFDITPLALLYPRLCELAQQHRAKESERHALREEAFLRRRDLIALLSAAGNSVPTARHVALDDLISNSGKLLRRRLDITQLTEMITSLATAIDEISASVDPKMSGNDTQIEQHHDTSKPEDSPAALNATKSESPQMAAPDRQSEQALPDAAQLLHHFPEAATYAGRDIRSDIEMRHFLEYLYPMMGIKPHVWRQLQIRHPIEHCAALLFSVLEKFSEITEPSRALLFCSDVMAEQTISLSRIKRCLGGFIKEHSQL